MRLIDADATLERECEDCLCERGSINCDFCEMKRMLSTAPTVDVEPIRHGHWIEDGDFQICSECGDEHGWQDYRASYCENCGAKMDEVSE